LGASAPQTLVGLPDHLTPEILDRAPFSFVLTDAQETDQPIVYINFEFERTSGYGRARAVGRNCRFLQGEGTDRGPVARIAEAVRAEQDITADILNYTAEGRPFWNRLMIAPLRDKSRRISHFMGVQKELSADPTREGELALQEVQHRVKNHLAMIAAMVRLQARNSVARTELDAVARRIQSLQLLYEQLSDRKGQNSGAIELGEYLARVARGVCKLADQAGIRSEVDVRSLTVPLQTAVSIGLILSELLTNVLKHAFQGRDTGAVRTTVREHGDGGIRVVVSDDGIGLPPPHDLSTQDGLGCRLMTQLAASLDARLDVASDGCGTTFTLDVPRGARGAF
jgi:PAS domain S-box-containing protein